MTRALTRSIGCGVSLVLLAAPAIARAADPAATCVARAITAVVKRTTSTVACHASAVAGAKPVSAACLARAASRCCASTPACVSAAEAASLADLIESVVADLVTAEPPGATRASRRCAAAKLRLAAKRAGALLACRAKAARAGRPVDPDCGTAADAGYRAKWTRTEARGGCATSADVDAIADRIDAFVTAVGDVFTPTVVSGTYDVTFDFSPPSSYAEPALGTVSVSSGGHVGIGVTFTEFNSLSLFGTVESAGTVALDGYFIMGGDILITAHGSGQVSSSGDPHRITATVDVPQQGWHIDLEMTRAAAGTAAVFSGTYAMTFAASPGCACTSTASIAIDVPASGFATTLPADDRDATSAVVGTFGAGSCQVAPGGRTSCWLPYDAVDPDSLGGMCESYLGSSCVVQMIGDLTPGAGGVSGGGSFILGSAPAIFDENGQWSAAK